MLLLIEFDHGIYNNLNKERPSKQIDKKKKKQTNTFSNMQALNFQEFFLGSIISKPFSFRHHQRQQNKNKKNASNQIRSLTYLSITPQNLLQVTELIGHSIWVSSKHQKKTKTQQTKCKHRLNQSITKH